MSSNGQRLNATAIISVTTTTDTNRTFNFGTKHYKIWAILNLLLALIFATVTVACDFLLRDGLASVEDFDFEAFMGMYRGVAWIGTIFWMINAIANLWSMDRVGKPRN